MPLPIPIGLPVAAPVHVGVPAVPPFAASHYGQYDSLPLLMTHSLPTKRVDKEETEQVGTRRSADPDYNTLIDGHRDTHTHTTHHHAHSSYGLPSGKIHSFL